MICAHVALVRNINNVVENNYKIRGVITEKVVTFFLLINKCNLIINFYEKLLIENQLFILKLRNICYHIAKKEAVYGSI